MVHFFEALLVISGIVILWFGAFLGKTLFSDTQ